ncbi:MAG TPA: hypothetical protein VGM67_05105 [Gemmatimonadaceae bacterium]
MMILIYRATATRRLLSSLLVAGLVAAAACEGTSNAQRAAKRDYGPDSMGVQPTDIKIVSTHPRSILTENSAAVMSEQQPGVFFTINDSGNDPILFAMDTSGTDRGAWVVRGATDNDWESGSMGPCAPTDSARECVYVGDTGDNMAERRTHAIYRIDEPAAHGQTDSVTAEQLFYRYSDAPHDVEAMYIAPNGDLFLITKRRLHAPSGALRQALVFRVPSEAWNSRDTVTAEIVDSLSIVPGSSPMRSITDASLAPDGRHLAVRTYSQLYVYATDSASGRVVNTVAPSICNIVALGEAQGEGVTWVSSTGRFLFTSEGVTEPIRLANCPMPAR